MHINRRFVPKGRDPFTMFEYEKRVSRISNPDGSVVFEMKDVEVPKGWSQLATDILASKYLRKAGLPDGGGETSMKQAAHRLAACWTKWGADNGYFTTKDDQKNFYDEISYMLLSQMAAPNSPQWFNTGLAMVYNIQGPAQGHWYFDPEDSKLKQTKNAYERPQIHACFIQSINDDLVNEGGIMDLWTREARLFKYGSGTGTNFSKLRGESEKLSGGGKSSGLMSFLKIGDVAAGAIKSGGTTRRAAKMVCLDLDHPDIEKLINWKVREEIKVAAMVEGIKHLPEDQQHLAKRLDLKLDYDFNGEAYATVSGQNSNNSIRIPNSFFRALDVHGTWNLTRRTDGTVKKTLPASELWEQITFAAWKCADPGVQFDDTINEWHTCPQSGRINASNPCSEYVFLDNTACNLASINLMKLFDAEKMQLDIEGFKHACRLWTIVLEISVLMASYPAKEIAKLSYDYRTLGLGYANLGTLLMMDGIPYDSEEGRAVCGAITAILTGEAYATSAEMAKEKGPFPGYAANKNDMLRVIRNHRAACDDSLPFEGLVTRPPRIDVTRFGKNTHQVNNRDLLNAARECWSRAQTLGEKFGYRNAQVTLIAPTGTIGLLMGCDTTGVEPDYALVKFKKLAGGGTIKIVNEAIAPALSNLGYTVPDVDAILAYVEKHGSLEGCTHVDPAHLPVFDCASGSRAIRTEGHILMMAAAQPFLSGAISKTINMQNSATLSDVKDAYTLGWKMGLKAVALYRDGCKLSQPLNTAPKKDKDQTPVVTKVETPAPHRKRLPTTRSAVTHKFEISGRHEAYVTVGLYEDGTPGELFITIAKGGSTIGGVMDVLATVVSIGLQYGVPLEDLVRKFEHVRFEPSGMTDNPEIPFAKSLIDYIFRWLGCQFLPGYKEANSPRRKQGDSPAAEAADDQGSHARSVQSDAPVCGCGAITVRSGACYKCTNCGTSLGCS